MRVCTECRGSVEAEHRFCPWCAAPQRRKLVEFFTAADTVPQDDGKALRVSRYLAGHHVRFSVWDEQGAAEAAVSLDDGEAARLARFLAGGQGQAPPPAQRRPSFLDELRALVGRESR